MTRSSDREITLFINVQEMRQFTNMPEQELIQYFDRISQEEEN